MAQTASTSPSRSGWRSGSEPPPGWSGRRALEEPVLNTAEQELDMNMDTALHDTGASYTGVEPAQPSQPGRAWAEWARAVERQVSERPVRAALVALGAGALAAWLLGRSLRSRRRRN